MKTLVISCTGEGMGHAARVAAVGSELRRDYRLLLLAPEKLHRFLQLHVPDAELYSLDYFAFVKKNERVEYVRTFTQNAYRLLTMHVTVRKIARFLQEIKPDACISDYDPFTPHAARRLRIPVMQMTHPAVVLRDPSLRPQAVTAKLLSWFLMGSYEERMLCSFYNGDVGPIVRRALTELPTAREEYYVVYLKPSYRRVVTRRLAELGITNVAIFPDPKKDFLSALASCKGVISSAGHQFMSEAIVLGKPAFVIPQRGQYEQELNARMLEQSGRGAWGTLGNLEITLPRFLEEIDHYPKLPNQRAASFSLGNDLARAVAKIKGFVEASGCAPRSILPLAG